MALDHQEIFAIAHMLQTAKGQIPSDEFAQGFLQGIHYMEVLHEIRVMETPDPPKHSKVGPVAPEKKSPLGPPPPPPMDGL